MSKLKFTNGPRFLQFEMLACSPGVSDLVSCSTYHLQKGKGQNDQDFLPHQSQNSTLGERDHDLFSRGRSEKNRCLSGNIRSVGGGDSPALISPTAQPRGCF